MKKLFLTSRINFVAQHLVKQIDLNQSKNFAFIQTPAEVETGSKKWLEADRQSLLDVGFSVSNYTIVA